MKVGRLLNLLRPHPKLTADVYDRNADKNADTLEARMPAGIPGPQPRADQAIAKPPRPDRLSPWHGSTGAMAPRARLPASVAAMPDRLDRGSSAQPAAEKPVARAKKPGSGRLLPKNAASPMPVIIEYPESARSSVSASVLSMDGEKVDEDALFYHPPPEPSDAPSIYSTLDSPSDPDMTGRSDES